MALMRGIAAVINECPTRARIFFFSSRIRHTRCLSDWISDVCSSDFVALLARGARLRLALIELGPIFVKFGQILSTRRDLLPADVADELSLLQDQVPPFPGSEASSEERRLGKECPSLSTRSLPNYKE